jgi:hypothetical protein
VGGVVLPSARQIEWWQRTAAGLAMLGLFGVSGKHWWGPAVGVVASLTWFRYGLLTRQFPLASCELVYAALYLLAVYRWLT